MSATSVIGIARKSLNWSVGFSVLMIIAGILAIAIPPAAGLAVNLVVAWLVILSGAMHLAFAWYTRTAGATVWEVLVGLLYGITGIYLLAQPGAGLPWNGAANSPFTRRSCASSWKTRRFIV